MCVWFIESIFTVVKLLVHAITRSHSGWVGGRLQARRSASNKLQTEQTHVMQSSLWSHNAHHSQERATIKSDAAKTDGTRWNTFLGWPACRMMVKKLWRWWRRFKCYWDHLVDDFPLSRNNRQPDDSLRLEEKCLSSSGMRHFYDKSKSWRVEKAQSRTISVNHKREHDPQVVTLNPRWEQKPFYTVCMFSVWVFPNN